MKTVILIILVLITTRLNAQEIKSIKTEKECLKFIHEVLKIEDFEFDTALNLELKTLLPKNYIYNKWKVIDFNNDQKLDLLFVGKYKKNQFRANIAKLCLTLSNSKYEVLNLIRPLEEPSFYPLVYFEKKANGNFLKTFLVFNSSWSEWDTIIQKKKNNYPEMIKWVDTLCYKYNSIINYNLSPSKIIFDSLQYDYRAGMMGTNFRIKIYKDGSAFISYPFEKDLQNAEPVKIETKVINEIRDLIYNIDAKSIRLNFKRYSTDLSFAEIKLFAKKKIYNFEDYGMESNFTLIKLYEIFFKIADKRYD